MKSTFSVFIIFLSLCSWAQIFDDFNDGDFTQNPQWIGNHELFKVNTSAQLQLDDNKEGAAYLSCDNEPIEDMEWRCWIKLSFSPSTNNNARFYLISDEQNLSLPLNGYFLQLGESGSDDAIELFRQDGTDIISVCRGINGTISSSFEIRIKVTHSKSGVWKVYSDLLGGEDFKLEAEGLDTTHSTTSNLGIYCKYTSSNSTKMYFDDVYYGPYIIDAEPPILQHISVESDSTLSLLFNENINPISALNTINYIVDNGIGNPTIAYRNETDPTQVSLVFDNHFENGKEYEITVMGLEDLSENMMILSSLKFNYYEPQLYDIVFNEIMADPSPMVGLPEFEYIELYNRTAVDIDLSGWVLKMGAAEKEFDNAIIYAKDYMLISNENAHNDLILYGNFYGFSSFSITNSGQSMELINDDGSIISHVSFTEDWYQNPHKNNGGWSIEQKNPDNLCSEIDNWKASDNSSGGTPGSINSNTDSAILLPSIRALEVAGNSTLILYFNQSMDEESLISNDAYRVIETISYPIFIYTFYDEPNKVELYFENEFMKGVSYDITISSSIKNCIGISMLKDTIITFGIPQNPEKYDIIINEILFNPLDDGEDYVELYNRSNHIFDLSEIRFGYVKHSVPNPPDTSIYNISVSQRLFLPKEFVVLTSSPNLVMDQYLPPNANAFLKVTPFAALKNDEGHVFINTDGNRLVDSFSYSENLQFPLLKYYDGVALEKVNPNVNISNNTNWHSAAESVGFGTPGYLNSQSYIYTDNENEITVEPKIFSPDNDGFEDVVSLNYNFKSPGYMMSVDIFNSRGYLTRRLINNEYLGTEGTVSWDGIDSNNTKSSVGIYIFYVTVYDINGYIKKYRKTCVLGAKL